MLKSRIKTDIVQAQKSGDGLAVETLRMLSSGIALKEKDLKYKQKLETNPELSDEQVIDVVSSEVKKRKDAIVLYERGNRPELAEKEQKEIKILKKYLPEQLPEQDLQKLVEESVAKLGAKEIKDMGKVMAEVTPKVKGKADVGEVAKIVKEILSK